MIGPSRVPASVVPSIRDRRWRRIH